MRNWSDSVNVAQAARKICVACWQVNNAFVPVHSCTGILKWVIVPTFRLLPYITFLPTLNSRRQRRAFGKTRRFGLAASSRGFGSDWWLRQDIVRWIRHCVLKLARSNACGWATQISLATINRH